MNSIAHGSVCELAIVIFLFGMAGLFGIGMAYSTKVIFEDFDNERRKAHKVALVVFAVAFTICGISLYPHL